MCDDDVLTQQAESAHAPTVDGLTELEVRVLLVNYAQLFSNTMIDMRNDVAAAVVNFPRIEKLLDAARVLEAERKKRDEERMRQQGIGMNTNFSWIPTNKVSPL